MTSVELIRTGSWIVAGTTQRPCTGRAAQLVDHAPARALYRLPNHACVDEFGQRAGLNVLTPAGEPISAMTRFAMLHAFGPPVRCPVENRDPDRQELARAAGACELPVQWQARR
jgi:hypothetical protein